MDFWGHGHGPESSEIKKKSVWSGNSKTGGALAAEGPATGEARGGRRAPAQAGSRVARPRPRPQVPHRAHLQGRDDTLPSSRARAATPARAPANMASPDASAMEDKVRSLPEGLRTKHPGTWRVVDVSDWVKGWGESFVSAALAVKENGIDGDTIKMALEEASLGANAAKSDLQGDVFRAHYPCPSLCVLLCVCVCVCLSLKTVDTYTDSMGIMRGQSLRFNKEMKIFTDLYSYFETTTRPGVLPGPGGNTSTLPLDLANTDSSTIATTLIEGGVSRVDLAHQLLRADVPNATTQTRILGASMRPREDEGWLAEESKARQKSQKVKAGMSAAKKNKVGPAGSLEACFQRQKTANE